MHFHTTTWATALTTLLTLTTALPTTLTTRDDTQCKPGTAFYVCQINNFRGCCSIDPCALESGCPDTTPTPSPSPTPSPTPSCPAGKSEIYLPKMQTYLSGSENPVSEQNINLTKSADKEWSQTMTFSVPSGAKSCTLMWGVPEERNFKAGDNALVRVWQGAKAEGDSIGAADFTNWPGVSGAHEHTVGLAECKEEMVFRARLEKESEVFLEQDGETGWYLHYEC
ncbi:hypothetical protein ETB97_000404 [Aspergillus alliaceus]|uniref:Ubiquitin 3 binding protein But2 C-terminal domain-containing protein n=1 Tax=Petromyces alliaceus TaxID=209559 RepID=A0A8H6E7E3_PETAA|nr:hypothetical protein ETB97_000404 [Aspergillus burnettii]